MLSRGFALGGGAELALACDLRVCNREAQFAFPETRLGIIPGADETQRLPRIVGLTRAKKLIFTGRRVDAHEALRIGLVDHFADEDICETAALSLARDVAAAAPLALRGGDRMIESYDPFSHPFGVLLFYFTV